MTKILLVEDDKSLREIYGVRLLAEGYDIVSAGDGEEALAMAIKERPALIVSDVMMPKISGFDMLDILRSTTETRDIKVIMMTALSSEDQRLRGEKLGADRYLVKSQVGIEDVVRSVHEVLGDLPGMTSSNHQPPTHSYAGPQQQQHQHQQSQPPAASYTTQQAASSELPQPTAPFAAQSIRPNGLGDRVIQPLQASQYRPAADVASMMEQELARSQQQPQAQQPQHMPQQQTNQQPQAQQPQPAPQQVTRPDIASLAPQPPAPRPDMTAQERPVSSSPTGLPSAPPTNPQPQQPPIPPAY